MTRENSRARAVALAAMLMATGVIGCKEKECGELSQSACERSMTCTALHATELSGGKTRDRYAGCQSSDLSCGAAITCARDQKTKRVALFTSTCIGPDWTPVRGNQCDAIHDKLVGTRAPLDSGVDDAGMDAGVKDSGVRDSGIPSDASPRYNIAADLCHVPVTPVPVRIDKKTTTKIVACTTGSGADKAPVREDLNGTPVCSDLSFPCIQSDGTSCKHECEADSDCKDGQICICSAGVLNDTGTEYAALTSYGSNNRCVPAECKGPADCGGNACGMSRAIGEQLNGTVICQITDGFFCRSAKDLCASDTNCGPNQICRYSSGRWRCEELTTCD